MNEFQYASYATATCLGTCRSCSCSKRLGISHAKQREREKGASRTKNSPLLLEPESDSDEAALQTGTRCQRWRKHGM